MGMSTPVPCGPGHPKSSTSSVYGLSAREESYPPTTMATVSRKGERGSSVVYVAKGQQKDLGTSTTSWKYLQEQDRNPCTNPSAIYTFKGI